MPSILVVEQEDRYVERIRAALSVEGWKVRVVPSADQAIQAAASEAPDLVLVSAEVPAAATLAGAFSRNGGGPGVLGLLPEGAAFPAPGFAPDDLLAKPFTDEALRAAAHRALGSHRPAAPAEAPAAARSSDQKLTSHDIFGDVLDEVEGPRTPAPAAPAGPPPLLTAAATAAARPAPPPAAPAQPSAPSSGDEMQRRLEKTLSGMLTPDRLTPGSTPDKPRPAAPAATSPAATGPAPRRGDTQSDNIDALLSRTLSNLDLGKTKTGVRPPPPASQPAAPPAAAPVPVRPATPAAAPAATAAPAPAAEGTAVRKARALGDFDFSELEELARSSRTATSAPPPARAPSPPPLPPPVTAQAPATAVRPPAAPAPPPPTPPAPPPFQPPAAAEPPVPPRPAEPAFSLAPESAATQRIPVYSDEPVEGERFGQYALLERIAAGGMAEVWKARMRGVEGFQKTVAIKRILPHMTDNAEFVGMFIDEAKLAAQLSHPNIVHIYDLGKIGRDYYIAMEYVEGRDLRSLLNAGRHKGLYLPLSLSLLIASRVANALDYAHRKRDFEDRELGLVHRDVSPQNVLLTYDGEVKLCDFGIAKAVSSASQTLIGALKGKLQYMSPEQAWGRPVDARSDLFSLGSVLFEMITGERLFPGDTEISVLESVRQGKVRSPRQVNPAVPKEVDDIVVRALAVAPQARFQSAGEMKQKLEAALASLGLSASSADLAAYVHRALQPGEPVPTAAERAPAPFPAPSAPVSWPPEPAFAAPAGPVIPEPLSPPPTESEASIEPVAAVGAVAMGEEGGRKSRTFLYAAIAALVVVAIVTFWFLNRRHGEAPAVSPAAPVASTPAPGAAPSGTPGSPQATPAATPGGVNVQALVDKQLAQKEEDMRKKLEQQQKDLEKQIAAAKAAGKPLPTAPAQTAGTPAPAVAVPAVRQPTPEPAAPSAAAAPEPQRREPEPAKVQEKAPEKPSAPAPEPAKPRVPEPAAAPRVKAGDLVEPGPGVSPPQLVNYSKPAYPPIARSMRVEGDVVVAVLVDENGQVQDAKVTEPIVQKVGINEAALSAARSAHYKPATKEGVRVKMWTRLRVPFKL
ncbi:MAG TPA: TonB family protein [Thermoanaerobaculia bacterium]|nr:TonB family protein [Thermoanaerobaculia bacterium]